MTRPNSDWLELLAALRAEARRPVPPPQDPPGVGRARLAELIDALHDAHITEDPDDPEGHPR